MSPLALYHNSFEQNLVKQNVALFMFSNSSFDTWIGNSKWKLLQRC